jgi:hypothetical protein
MMRESDRLYEICQQFHQRVKQHSNAELEAFLKGDPLTAKINGAARLAWLDAWQIIIDHMRQIADSVGQGVEGGES